MKIIRKVKMPKVTCVTCGCEYVPRKKDLKTPTFIFVKCMAKCPICDTENIVFKPQIPKEKDVLGE